MEPAPGPDSAVEADTSLAEVVLSCADLGPMLEFFADLGFELEMISPADGPTDAIVVGHGLRLGFHVEPEPPASSFAPRIRIRTAGPAAVGPDGHLIAPNGSVVEVVSLVTEPVMPPISSRFEFSSPDDSGFAVGRAGMQYRDLLAERQGDRFVASHIRIEDGGPVPDYVHFHRIRFQMIYCHRGWVRLVYEDQGPPFLIEAGDCVLQPPGIRHRVLECSAGLEVVEVGCPAHHDTLTDRAMELPTTVVDSARSFGGQRFVRHHAADAVWQPGPDGRSTSRDFGIGPATDGLAGVRVVRGTGDAAAVLSPDADTEFFFVFITSGSASLRGPDGTRRPMPVAAAAALPAGGGYRIDHWSPDFEGLEVSLPALS